MANYYNWLKKIISFCISTFLILSVISTLYVFTTPFEGYLKYIILLIVILAYLLAIYFFKKRIKDSINKLLIYINKIDSKKLLLIICLLMIVLKIIYTIFCYFDGASGGDPSAYNDIANIIYQTGNIPTKEISHLVGIGLHLAVFKFLHIPYHIGIFVIFFIGTIFNFYSFKSLVGKSKAFLLIVIYLLMPSTMLLTFCPTHELFVYLYASISIFILNIIISENNKLKLFVLSILLIIITCLCNLVSPIGTILLIIFGLVIVLSNINTIKKLLLVIIIIFSILGNTLIEREIGLRESDTTINTYTILICGSSVETNGEHVDYYGSGKIAEYIEKNNLESTYNNRVYAGQQILIEQYKYLFTHPIEFVKLIAHKFYIYWSGDHYSIEMAYSLNGINEITNYVFLVISAVIYLFVLTIGIVFKNEKEYDIKINNYELLMLGVIATLLISLALNKYSVYLTIFIYLVCFYRSNFE